MPAPNTRLGALTTFSSQLKPLETWTKAVADRINGISPLPATEGSNLTQIPGVGSTAIADPFLFDPAQIKLGVVQSSGPGGASNYTDNRYWWKEGLVIDNDTSGNAVNSPVTVIVNPGTWNSSAQTLTNLGEAASTHGITTGSILAVFPVTGVVGTAGSFTYQQWVSIVSTGTTSSSSSVSLSEHNFVGTLTTHAGTREPCGLMNLGPGFWQVNANILISSGGGSTVSSVSGGMSDNGTTVTYGQAYTYLPLPATSDGAGFTVPTAYLDNRTVGGTTPIWIIAGSVSSTNQAYYGYMSALKLM